MAFTDNEKKDVLLNKLAEILRRLHTMTLAEIYAYLLGQVKDNFVNDINTMLDTEETELGIQETEIKDRRKNIKDYQKELEGL